MQRAGLVQECQACVCGGEVRPSNQVVDHQHHAPVGREASGGVEDKGVPKTSLTCRVCPAWIPEIPTKCFNRAIYLNTIEVGFVYLQLLSFPPVKKLSC